MLVLSRQKNQTIMIGDTIEITVVDIRGEKVRLGITAPTEVPVHRKEVYEAIQAENRQASQVRPEDLPEETRRMLYGSPKVPQPRRPEGAQVRTAQARHSSGPPGRMIGLPSPLSSSPQARPTSSNKGAGV